LPLFWHQQQNLADGIGEEIIFFHNRYKITHFYRHKSGKSVKSVKWVDLSVNRLGHIQRICLPTSEDECAGRETRLGKVHQRAKPLQPYYA
jgi:hypothetical protein